MVVVPWYRPEVARAYKVSAPCCHSLRAVICTDHTVVASCIACRSLVIISCCYDKLRIPGVDHVGNIGDSGVIGVSEVSDNGKCCFLQGKILHPDLKSAEVLTTFTVSIGVCNNMSTGTCYFRIEHSVSDAVAGICTSIGKCSGKSERPFINN